MDYSRFDLEKAENLIKNGFDGSQVNKLSLIKAKNLLLKAAKDFKDFADKNADSNPAKYLYSKANEFIRFANMVESWENKIKG